MHRLLSSIRAVRPAAAFFPSLRRCIVRAVRIVINGQERQTENTLTLAALVQELGMKPDRVAVELNREIVPRDRWSKTRLQDGDQKEIVHFVGGGRCSQA